MSTSSMRIRIAEKIAEELLQLSSATGIDKSLIAEQAIKEYTEDFTVGQIDDLSRIQTERNKESFLSLKNGVQSSPTPKTPRPSPSPTPKDTKKEVK